MVYDFKLLLRALNHVVLMKNVFLAHHSDFVQRSDTYSCIPIDSYYALV